VLRAGGEGRGLRYERARPGFGGGLRGQKLGSEQAGQTQGAHSHPEAAQELAAGLKIILRPEIVVLAGFKHNGIYF
jgi:hypothetical protein